MLVSMNMMLGSFRLGLAALALIQASLCACGSSIEPEPDDGAGGAGGVGGGAPQGGEPNEGGGADVGGAPSVGAGDAGGAGEGGIGEGGGGGGGSQACAAMSQISLSNPVLLEAGGDSVWSAGESASLRVTMTNESAEDNFFYPGIAVSADVEGFESSGNTLFGIFGSESTAIDFAVQAPLEVAAGTAVTLTIQATTLEARCADLDAVELTITID